MHGPFQPVTRPAIFPLDDPHRQPHRHIPRADALLHQPPAHTSTPSAQRKHDATHGSSFLPPPFHLRRPWHVAAAFQRRVTHTDKDPLVANARRRVTWRFLKFLKRKTRCIGMNLRFKTVGGKEFSLEAAEDATVRQRETGPVFDSLHASSGPSTFNRTSPPSFARSLTRASHTVCRSRRSRGRSRRSMPSRFSPGCNR